MWVGEGIVRESMIVHRERADAAGKPERDASAARIAELERAVAARDDLIAIAGHELRNAVTPLQAQVEILVEAARRNGHGTDLLPRLQSLQRMTASYVRRATVLLNVASLTAGAPWLDIATVNLSEIVREAVAAVQPIAEKAGSPITREIESDVRGRWDRSALEQIIENLLSNAIKYGAGTPISVGLARETDRARLWVRDGGCGIAAADQNRIFGRFERAVSRRSTGGFGLGLWISHRLIRAMQGEILVASSPGKGSCFTVILPHGSE